MRPPSIKRVTPTNIAAFLALRWEDNAACNDDLEWMVAEFGWRHGGVSSTGRLVLFGRAGKRYVVKPGEWIIALGANGSLRVVSDRQYRNDYREVSN